MKDLICLSELPLIPILNHSEQSAVAEVFFLNHTGSFRCGNLLED